MKINRNEPLPSHTKWKIDECYAKVILESLFPERYNNLQIADKPDLRENKSCIGIEVTSAIPQKERERTRLWVETNRLGEGEKKTKNIERMEQLGLLHDGGMQVWPEETYRMDAFEVGPFGGLVSAFEEKIRKLNSGQYANQYEYDLFVHSNLSMPLEVLARWMPNVLEEILQRNQGARKYTYVYFLSFCALQIWNLQSKTFKMIPRNDEFLNYEWTARELVIEREEREEDEQT